MRISYFRDSRSFCRILPELGGKTLHSSLTSGFSLPLATEGACAEASKVSPVCVLECGDLDINNLLLACPSSAEKSNGAEVVQNGPCHVVDLCLEVKVSNLWQACEEFEPNTVEHQPCRGGRYMLNMSRLKCPPVGVVWNLGEENVSSGVVLVTLPWFKIMRSIALSPRTAL
ncbi:hypothetical protein TNCV_2601411 [Trichonephila clavipes]|nr:hypothetical protein TNCV_2601411 [Trichonephila clavipes]